MASKTVNVGARGRWKVVVDQSSQNIAANTSRVRVRGIMYNDGNGTSADGYGVNWSISGTNSRSGNDTFSVPGGGSKTFVDESFTVTHDANGYKSVSYKVTLGDTITSTFGSGGSATVGLTLTRIPKAPKAVGQPTTAITAGGTVTISWTAPDNMGSAITEYQVEYANNEAFEGSTIVSASTSTSKAISGLAPSSIWYFRVRAKNSIGVGPWSPVASRSISDPPAAPDVPTFTYSPPSGVNVYFNPPSDGGSPITEYDIRYSTSPTFDTETIVSGTSAPISVTGLTAGVVYYFQVRARNINGIGPWSAAASSTSSSGPRVRKNDSWATKTLVYVKANGVWRLAVPYVRKDGVWKAVN